MSETQDIFESYQGAPVTSQCYKELGRKIHQCSEPEREALFASFQPKELHLQLLKLTVARTCGYDRPLLDALKDDCTFLSRFSLNSKVLFCGNNTELLDTNVLLPLLQTVSARTRNRILWNLGKHVSTGNNSKVSETDVDNIYTNVSKVWGSNVALPLLCQTSREVLERELQSANNLSNSQLLVIAKKSPSLALSFLEKGCRRDDLRKAARHVVRKTIPKSFDYIVKQGSSFLTKSMMKIILKEHFLVIMESPSTWMNVLDKHTVRKVLKPEDFELFLAKQMMELKDHNVPYTLLSYFEMLSSNEVSSIFNKVFPEKYGCPLRLKLDFWEKNVSLLKLLDTSDRSYIAVELNTKDPLSTCWLPLMATDVSIPRIKKILSTEQDGRARARHISQLIETALLNKDQIAIEDICNMVVSRYRNDKTAIQCFFNSGLDFSSLSTETFDVVFAAANRFYDPDDWQTHGAAKLFPVAIKRNWGESGLKEYLQYFMKGTRFFTLSDLYNLENKLRLICVEEVFTPANIENRNVLRQLAQFLHLITKWAPTTSSSLITDNVKDLILTLLKCDIDRLAAVAFVCGNLNSLNTKFVEDCFQYVPKPKLMTYLFHKKSHLLSNEEELKRIGKHMVEVGVRGYVSLLTKFKKLGYSDLLHHLANESKVALASTDTDKLGRYTNAVVLLMLTSPADDFFSEMDPLLPSADNNKADKSQGVGDGGNQGRYCPLRASKREDAVYYGLGMSISHLEIPALAVERLRRFCVSGDLILFVRDALYSVSGSLPNEKAKTFLLSLMRQPVSVKKHALRLLWRAVCNIETQEVLLLKLMESEEHLTMRIILMKTAFSLLHISKSSSMWQVVKQMITKLTPDDKTIVLDIVNKTVPDPFLEEFYKIVLEKCKTLKDVENACVINDVIQCVSHVMTLMSEKFIEGLITEFFISKMFSANVFSHCAIVEVVLGYLKGEPGSKLPGNVVEPRKNLSSRWQFLKERLDSSAMYGPLDVFDSVQGVYPVRRLLTSFIERFCGSCLSRHSKTTHEYQLTEYIDFLLSYFDPLNPNCIIMPSICLSLIKVLNLNASKSEFVLGQEIGEFCDSTLGKGSAALFCYFPTVVAKFVNGKVIQSSQMTSSQVIDMLNGMLATVPPGCGSDNLPQDSCNMLRLITVAHIIPSQWLVADDYKDFRQTFLALVKNTPVEEFLFNARL